MAKQPKRLTKKQKIEVAEQITKTWALKKLGLCWDKRKFRQFQLDENTTMEVFSEYCFDKAIKNVRFIGRSNGVEVTLQRQPLTESIIT